MTNDDAVDEVRAILAILFEPKDINTFLEAPNDLLGGAKPLDLIRDGRAGEVLQMLERATIGGYL